MKKISYPFFLSITLLSLFYAGAQPSKSTLKSKPNTAKQAVLKKSISVKDSIITDTLAYNIRTTVNKIALYVNDPEKPVGYLTESFLGNFTYGQPEYSSIIRFPGAVENKIIRLEVNREDGTILWEWQSTLVRCPNGEIPEERLKGLEQRINDIGRNINFSQTDTKNKMDKTSGYYSKAFLSEKNDEVLLSVQFIKPLLQTEQQSIDSVQKIYLPGFNTIETAENASEKYCEALLAEGISKAKVVDLMEKEIESAGNKNIKIAYQMMSGIGLQNGINKSVMEKLPISQREKIRATAQALLDAYREGKPFDIKTYTPPPPPQINPYISETTSFNPNLYKREEPSGEKVRCAVCDGYGEMEIVGYSHTYQGIFNTIQTISTRRVKCSFCGGTGWVIKKKKK